MLKKLYRYLCREIEIINIFNNKTNYCKKKFVLFLKCIFEDKGKFAILGHF